MKGVRPVVAQWRHRPITTGAGNREAITRATGEVLRISGISREDITAVVSTGYGRDSVEDRLSSVTEIMCHATMYLHSH